MTFGELIMFAVRLLAGTGVFLVGVHLLNLVETGQAGVGIAFGFEDFDFALRSKYIFQDSSSFRCFCRTMAFSSRMTRWPLNSIR